MKKEAATEEAITYRFRSFGTIIELSAFGKQESLGDLFLDTARECRRYENLFSRNIPSSDVGRINDAKGREVIVSEETYELLALSLAYCEKSLGCFDITMGALSRLWDYRAKALPKPEEIEGALAYVDYREVSLSGVRGNRRVRIGNGNAEIDLGGTAKGYVADRITRMFESRGQSRFIVNIGGNTTVRGRKPDGSRFRVGIKDPTCKAKFIAVLEIEDASLATSGLTERAFVKDGKRFHHILSPSTGRPVITDAESATIITASGMECEGYSTTACALGIERGLRYVSSIPEVLGGVFVSQEGTIRQSLKTP